MEVSGNTFIYVHVIWNTADEKALLPAIVRKVLFPYIKQSAAAKGVQLLAVNGVNNHIHCLVKLSPFQSLQQVVTTLKLDSLHWLNETKLLAEAFDWNEGFSAYSVSPSTIDKSVEYINKQEEYHKTRSLSDEMSTFEKMVVTLS